MTVDPGRLGNVNVRVCWGPRAETAAAIAERWRATIQGLAALEPPVGGWVVLDEDDNDRPLSDDDLPLLLDGRGRDTSTLGHKFTMVNGDPNAAVFFSATAGSTAAVPGLLNLARVEGTAAALGDLQAILLVLVTEWDPDHGEIYGDRWIEAQRPGRGEPIAGAVTYLSAARARQIPANLPAAVRPMPGDGVLLSLIEPDGAIPSLDRVMDLADRLRVAGAFAPVPTDAAHWHPEIVE
ncbi:hypothetical protein [Dactylosporangium salmoneum]|uniref:Immunity protein 52 domain-containing protein n=1 Tax=Dactylosporangium salmoneum TaxID=53361 RepID=A0ABN3HAA7_9ACTN